MQLQDIPTISEWMADMPLWRRYHITPERAGADFAAALQRGELVLVAAMPETLPGESCGFAWCVPGGAFGRTDYLRLIGVRPDCAGHGVGAALLSEVEAHATSNDLILLVSDFNRDAQRFYRRLGYRKVGAIPGYVLPDVTELIFRKRLVSQE